MTPAQAEYVAFVKQFMADMTLDQLKAIKDYADAEHERELRLAAEGMVAAFDARPDGEPEGVTRTTRECALESAKQILGWST